MRCRIKMCGMTNSEDALFAESLGADYVGFIMAPESPRCVTEKTVKDIVGRMRSATCSKVGVFVNETPERVVEIMTGCGLDIAQLHGEETEVTVERIGPERVWKVCRLTSRDDIAAAYTCPAAALLIDTQHKGRRGGTGQVGDWDLAAEVASSRRVVLAGGLNAGNVGAAVQKVKPFAVDVSSGVERQRGIKDHELMRAFVAALRTT